MPPHLDRRQFLGLTATGALLALHPSLLALPVRRVGILSPAPAERDPATRAALDGLLLGRDEAVRTARLFGRSIEFVAEELDAGADAARVALRLIDAGADALITTLGTSRVREVAPVAIRRRALAIHLQGSTVAAAPHAPPVWNLHLAPAPEARAAAVLAALHGARAAALSRSSSVLVARSAEDAALARHADHDASRAAGARPLLPGREAALAAGVGGANIVFLAAQDTDDAATLTRGIGGGAFTGTLVDLFGSTEHLPPQDLPGHLVRADSWTPALERFGAAQLNDRFAARFGPDAAMRGPAWAGWFAAKAVAEASLRAGSGDGVALADTLRSARFDGHQGRPLSFAPDGTLAHPLHVIGLTDPAH